MGDLWVDPGILRAFAGCVDECASTIESSDLPATFGRLAALMPGSSTAFVAAAADPVLQKSVDEMAAGYHSMGSAVRVGADTYQARDDELASELDAIVPESR